MFLSSLPSQLKALKKASLPFQQQLGLHCTKRSKQHQLVELLPVPLFILYTQILNQKEAFDGNIELKIVGEVKDAQAIAYYQQAMGNSDITIHMHEESKSIDDIEKEDDDSYCERKKVKRCDLKGSLEHEVYSNHPLSALWHIHDEGIKEVKAVSCIIRKKKSNFSKKEKKKDFNHKK